MPIPLGQGSGRPTLANYNNIASQSAMAIGAGKPRLDYHVQVRDYTWNSNHNGAAQSRRVQSPHPTIEDAHPLLVVRPVDLKRQHKDEKAQHASELVDDICAPPYTVHAHGVLIPNTDTDDVHPIWVFQGLFNLQEALPIKVVDLSTYEVSELLCSLICWVPSSRRPDGALITLLLRGKPFCVAVCQIPGSPDETKLIQVTTKELAGYDKIKDHDQQDLFERQLAAVRTASKAPAPASPPQPLELVPPATILENIRRLRSSALRMMSGIPSRRMSEEDLEVPGFTPSDWNNDSSTRSSTDYSSDDDLEHEDYDTYQKPLFSKPAYCCKYSDLGPSLRNPFPRHRHATDHECALGSGHENHCVFADFAPDDCVILTSGEPHEHCQPIEARTAVLESPPVKPSQQHLQSFTQVTENLTVPSTAATSEPDSPTPPTDTFDFLDDLMDIDFSTSCPDSIPMGETDDFYELPINHDNLMTIDGLGIFDSPIFSDENPNWLPAVDLDALPATPRPHDFVF